MELVIISLSGLIITVFIVIGEYLHVKELEEELEEIHNAKDEDELGE